MNIKRRDFLKALGSAGLLAGLFTLPGKDLWIPHRAMVTITAAHKAVINKTFGIPQNEIFIDFGDVTIDWGIAYTTENELKMPKKAYLDKIHIEPIVNPSNNYDPIFVTIKTRGNDIRKVALHPQSAIEWSPNSFMRPVFQKGEMLGVMAENSSGNEVNLKVHAIMKEF